MTSSFLIGVVTGFGLGIICGIIIMSVLAACKLDNIEERKYNEKSI